MTNMVMEFPDVQGVMGKYYGLHDGEPAPVANALYEQYLPRFAGDVLPQAPESAAVALADKFDTLVGIFGIGQLPKGDKDPFALRRAAIGVLRIITEDLGDPAHANGEIRVLLDFIHVSGSPPGRSWPGAACRRTG